MMWPSSPVWLAFSVCSLCLPFSGKYVKYCRLVIIFLGGRGWLTRWVCMGRALTNKVTCLNKSMIFFSNKYRGTFWVDNLVTWWMFNLIKWRANTLQTGPKHVIDGYRRYKRRKLLELNSEFGQKRNNQFNKAKTSKSVLCDQTEPFGPCVMTVCLVLKIEGCEFELDRAGAFYYFLIELDKKASS